MVLEALTIIMVAIIIMKYIQTLIIITTTITTVNHYHQYRIKVSNIQHHRLLVIIRRIIKFIPKIRYLPS